MPVQLRPQAAYLVHICHITRKFVTIGSSHLYVLATKSHQTGLQGTGRSMHFSSAGFPQDVCDIAGIDATTGHQGNLSADLIHPLTDACRARFGRSLLSRGQHSPDT